MTNHRVGKTNTRDPRGGWRAGKSYKGKRSHRSSWDSTNRFLRRQVRAILRRDPKGEDA